jgi:hypothetical protein
MLQAALKDQVSHLSESERRELVSYVVALQTDGDEDLQEKLARKIADQTPGNWVELDDLRRRTAW